MTKAWKERLPFFQSSYYTLQFLQAISHLLPFPSTITSPCRSPSLIRYNPVGVFQHKPDPWPRADFTLLCKRQTQVLLSHIPTSYSSLSLQSGYVESQPSERSLIYLKAGEPVALNHLLSKDNQQEGYKITRSIYLLLFCSFYWYCFSFECYKCKNSTLLKVMTTTVSLYMMASAATVKLMAF